MAVLWFIFKAIILLGLTIPVVGVAIVGEIKDELHNPLIIGNKPYNYTVHKGQSLRTIAQQLHERGLLRSPWLLRIPARITGLGNQIQVGEYAIPVGATPLDLLHLFTSGRVVQYQITIPEGWAFADLVRHVARHPKLQVTVKDKPAITIMAALGSATAHPEGRFFPDTYFITKGMRDLDLYRRAYQRMEKRLAELWQARAPDLPYNDPDEALIMASIIEKETGAGSERTRIAGVFVRRLRRGMKLQTDPTVIYGMGTAFDGNLRRRDLKNDTPYNTYVHHGLPPTPIALPGAAAIYAALHPAKDNALYFVAKGDGTHQFSATLAEHNRAVARYQLRHR